MRQAAVSGGGVGYVPAWWGCAVTGNGYLWKRVNDPLLEIQYAGGTRWQATVAVVTGPCPLLEWRRGHTPLLKRHRAEARGDRRPWPVKGSEKLEENIFVYVDAFVSLWQNPACSVLAV